MEKLQASPINQHLLNSSGKSLSKLLYISEFPATIMASTIQYTNNLKQFICWVVFKLGGGGEILVISKCVI